jgi:hypothetical protein
MNTSKQFWSLIRFQAAVSPFIWILPIAFATPLFFMVRDDSPLNQLVMSQNLFLVVLFGALLIAPEVFTSCSAQQTTGLGPEFIRTRAVDKQVLVRARAAFFYAVLFAAPLGLILYSLWSPDLRVSIYSKVVRLDCLSHVPGSALVTDAREHANLVSIPSGRFLVAEWHAFGLVVLAAAVQVFVYWTYPSRFRKLLFWALIIGISAAPLADALWQRHSMPCSVRLFFLFAGHQALSWTLAAGILILGQLWSERLFARLEQ